MLRFVLWMQTRLAKWETKRKGWDKWSNNGLLTKKRERREIWTNREVVNFCPADRASSTRERKEKKGKKKKLRSVEVRVCVCDKEVRSVTNVNAAKCICLVSPRSRVASMTLRSPRGKRACCIMQIRMHAESPRKIGHAPDEKLSAVE